MIQQTVLAVLLASCAIALPYGTNFNQQHHQRFTTSMIRHEAPVQHIVQTHYAPGPVAPITEEVRRPAVHVPIVSLHAQSDDNGAYAFRYESADGTKRTEKGDVRPAVNPEAESDVAQVMEGTVSWTSPEGIHFNLKYVADENGYRAVGDHLPVAPPTPEAILKALSEIEAAKANEAAQQQNGMVNNVQQTMTRGRF